MTEYTIEQIEAAVHKCAIKPAVTPMLIAKEVIAELTKLKLPTTKLSVAIAALESCAKEHMRSFTGWSPDADEVPTSGARTAMRALVMIKAIPEDRTKDALKVAVDELKAKNSFGQHNASLALIRELAQKEGDSN